MGRKLIYLDDALDILDDLQSAYENGFNIYADSRKQMLDLQSAQPEIIRCKDCKNWDTTWERIWAKDYHYCPLIETISKEDFYCSEAERKNNG